MDEALTPSKIGTSGGRRQELLRMARAVGRVEVTAASEALGVSAETVRRDLRAMEDQGLIRRSYGVAFPLESGAFETVLSNRASINPEEKVRIADAAVLELKEAQTIFLDEGFQTQLLAHRLPETTKLTVITSSLPIANLLAARSNVQVLVLGGRVRGNTLGIVDHWAADMLKTFNIDLAYIGANGVSLDGGVTTPDPSVAMVKAAAIRVARRRIFIGAHHKFGTSTFVRFAELDDFERMVTGHEMTPSVAAQFVAAGARIVRV
jgi:DeoR family transcriptional regulator, fructose operon transcriptional repressor